MTDWREQAYEDQYWAEWTGRNAAIAAAVETWNDETSALFLQAVEQAGATRAEERDDVIDQLGELNN